MTRQRRTIHRLAAGLLAGALILVLVPGLALGHAELETATPTDGSVVTEPVTEVVGTYSAAMLPDGSSLVVEDANGNVVATGGVDPDDDTRMVATPDAPLGDGDYRVKSTTVATDGDLERAQWSFTVAVAASPSPSASPTATAAPTQSPVASQAASPIPATPTPVATSVPTPTPSAEGTASGTGSDVILPIVLALVVLGAGAAYLLTRRNRPSDPT